MVHPELHEAFRTDEARPLHDPARGRAVLRGRVGAIPLAVEVNLDVLRADHDLDLTLIRHAGCQKLAKGRFRERPPHGAANDVDF